MAGKRKNDDPASTELTGREKKKQKIAVARTIAVQQPSGSTAPQQNNAVAGPSRSVHFQGKQLPGALDVERFAEARAFEIDAMHTAMQTARQSASSRAWQELPRHLRRRAASHDVRRVPLRLRDKARAEMDPARKKALGRAPPKRGKDKQIKRTTQLLNRQRDKVWLETHIWHAKRMKMENMWGYRLAVQPTEKSFRPSHRASVHGSIIHDASYFGLLQLSGPESILKPVLEHCCDPQGPSPATARFLTGGRVCDTHIYKYGAYPFDLIGPITVIWQSQSDKMHTPPGPSTRHRAKHQKKEQAAPIPETPKRMVWIRAHPSVFSEVYKALQTSTSYALEAAKKSNECAAEVDLVVEISDLRERLNIFEIMGPKSSQIIKGALKPTLQSRKEFTAFWQSLGNLQTTASLPRNMVIGFTVNDPRLTFPPKNAHVQTNLTSSPVAGIFPTSLLALSDIWAEEVRDKLQKPKFKKKDLDQRRSQSDNPGTSLQSTLHDDRIPVLLIQRSLESSPDGAPSGSSSQLDSPSLHGWTLVIPSGWSMPFFSSLIYTGTRVAGQRERQTQAFEAGKPYFPRDYPACKEYQQYSDDREEKESERWQKKPPAKRPNYQVLLTRSPWQPDWDVVLGLQPPPPMDLPAKTSADFVETQRHQAKDMKPWLLRGPNVGRILEAASTMFNHAAGLHEEINKLRTKRLLDPLPASVRADNLWKTALITVKLRMCGRGRPEDLAMIYIVDDEEHGQWTASFNKDAMLTDDQEDQLELANRQMHTDNIIGYVTTGNFSLSLGEAYAIGAVPLARLFELKEQATRMGKYPHLLVKVRDRGETVYRAAHLEVIEG